MMRRTHLLAMLLVVGTIGIALSAQAPAPGGGQRGRGGPTFPPLGDARKLKDNLYLIEGQGGNTLFFVMGNGVAVVDTKLANNGQGILDRIRTVTSKPVTLIINTHTHGDHTGSNPFFGMMVERVAHENTKTNMAKLDAFKGDNAALLPNKTFNDKLSVGSGPDRIDLYYFGAGHTNGDALVVFPSLRTMHAGDLFAWKQLPIVDRNNGGSYVAYGTTIEKAASGVKNVDTVVTGHSTVMAFNDFVEFGEFNREFLKAVQEAKRAGKTAEQAAAELKLPAKFASYIADRPVVQGGDFQPTADRIKGNVTGLYAELDK
jgi:glyoxylase-like metal-dependent hydrolase (beta-lactamase superfamily II)